MFWTAFIWGLGTTLGGSIGLMAFVVMFGLSRSLTESNAARAAHKLNELSLAALKERNELTERQIDALQSISNSIDRRIQ